MGLSLTSTAALHLDNDARGESCLGRGLDGQELVVSTAEALEALATRASASQAHVVALRVESIDKTSAPIIALLSGHWDVPVSVPAKGIDSSEVAAVAGIFAAAKSRLYVSHPTDLTEALQLISALGAAKAQDSIGLAWEVSPATENLDEAGAVLFAVREHLGLVRLYGGGPEQHDQEGKGLGPLLTDLAMSQYKGPIVLNPSSDENLPRWHKWLESRKPTGCGSGGNAKELKLDVRKVEPKDRLETILGAYKALQKGATLKLTVDHDPSCMYYMLEATEPPDSFAFKITDKGPEVWRAEVKKPK